MKIGKRLVQGLFIGLSMFICLTSAFGDPYSILHNFGDTGDGTKPYYGGPALSGSTLYGMTQGGGGDGSYGTLYKINTDGSGYQILHHFTSGTDGTTPRGSLTVSGATIYGCTEYGGGSNGGTIFKINTDGGGYQVLKRFIMGTEQNCPYGPPVVWGSTLYGLLSTAGSGPPSTARFTPWTRTAATTGYCTNSPGNRMMGLHLMAPSPWWAQPFTG